MSGLSFTPTGFYNNLYRYSRREDFHFRLVLNVIIMQESFFLDRDFLLRFAKEQNFTLQQISAFFTLLKVMLDNIKGISIAVWEMFQNYKNNNNDT